MNNPFLQYRRLPDRKLKCELDKLTDHGENPLARFDLIRFEDQYGVHIHPIFTTSLYAQDNAVDVVIVGRANGYTSRKTAMSFIGAILDGVHEHRRRLAMIEGKTK